MGLSLNGKASVLHADAGGSIPSSPTKLFCSSTVERFFNMEEDVSSNLIGTTKIK